MTTGIGINVEGFGKGLPETVNQLLRLATADAPPEVRCASLNTLRDLAKRPLSISHCNITVPESPKPKRKKQK